MGRGGGRPPVDTTPATATGAEKNELGYIIFAYNIGYQTDEAQIHGMFTPFGTVAKVSISYVKIKHISSLQYVLVRF